MDGELVVLAPEGRPDFDLLQQRSNRPPPNVQARKHPASYYAFDIASLDDIDLCRLPWEQRHEILEAQDLADVARVLPHTTDWEATLVNAWTLPPKRAWQGAKELLEAARSDNDISIVAAFLSRAVTEPGALH